MTENQQRHASKATSDAQAQRIGRVQVRKRYLPLGIDISGLKCLVIGGGRIGTHKALTLVEAGAQITIVSPDVPPRLRGAASRQEVTWVAERYSPWRIGGHFLVVAATNDPQLNFAISEDCKTLGILCCVVSPGRYSQVVFPAVYRDDQVTVAIHSDGRDCSRSRKVRDEVAHLLGREKAGSPELCVFGVIRGDVPEEFFAALSKAFGTLSGSAGLITKYSLGECMLLATCPRWECRFLPEAPQAGEGEVRKMIHERCGLLPEPYREAFYLKTSGWARLHLLSVGGGLCSPLIGETEIIGQLREARNRQVPFDGSPLSDVFNWVLSEQKIIRRNSGLRPVGGSWAERAAALCTSALPAGRPGIILVIGLGRLGGELLRLLLSLSS